MKKATSANGYSVSAHRWAILFLLVPIILSSEIFWLTFAPIAGAAKSFYHVSALGVDLFSMSYLLMYILFTIPASYVIEEYGYRTSMLIGAALTAVFGITRFLFADVFSLVLISQFLIAIGQPFLVNISTKVPANWFPVEERATASGILVMAQYLGFIVPMVLSPVLFEKGGMRLLLGVYAAVALVSALLPVLFAKERPETPPGPELPKEPMGLKSMGALLTNRSFVAVLAISFISMGVFNTIMTMIDQIFKPKGISALAVGIVGASFVVSGIIGAVVLPMISDKLRRRTPFFNSGISLLGLLCAGLTFLKNYVLLLIVSILLGFIIMGLAPILFQHGAEVAYPAHEGTSFGLIMLMGQISGALFIYLFDLLGGLSGSILPPMLFLVVLACVQIPVAFGMKESRLLLESRK